MSSNDATRQKVYLAGVITSCIITFSSLILAGLMFFFSEDRTFVPTLILVSTGLGPIIIMLKTLVSSDKDTPTAIASTTAADIPPVLKVTQLVEKEDDTVV